MVPVVVCVLAVSGSSAPEQKRDTTKGVSDKILSPVTCSFFRAIEKIYIHETRMVNIIIL
jgi:hypothetical protein